MQIWSTYGNYVFPKWIPPSSWSSHFKHLQQRINRSNIFCSHGFKCSLCFWNNGWNVQLEIGLDYERHLTTHFGNHRPNRPLAQVTICIQVLLKLCCPWQSDESLWHWGQLSWAVPGLCSLIMKPDWRSSVVSWATPSWLRSILGPVELVNRFYRWLSGFVHLNVSVWTHFGVKPRINPLGSNQICSVPGFSFRKFGCLLISATFWIINELNETLW